MSFIKRTKAIANAEEMIVNLPDCITKTFLVIMLSKGYTPCEHCHRSLFVPGGREMPIGGRQRVVEICCSLGHKVIKMDKDSLNLNPAPYYDIYIRKKKKHRICIDWKII